MGTDIAGWVEARDAGEPWRAVQPLGALYTSRDYDAFGCLFGVRNHAGFRPLAAGRGLPSDATTRTRAAHDEAAAADPVTGTTWLAWSELRTVDWSEPAERPDRRVHRYAVDADGTERYDGKSSWSAELGALTGTTLADWSTEPPVDHSEGTEWRTEHAVFRVERLRRRAAVEGWWPVFAELERLAGPPGEGGDARVVVWFDQ